MRHPFHTILASCALASLLFGARLAEATPTIRDIRDTITVVPVNLEQGSSKIFIKKGEDLQLLRLYHDTGNAWSWHDFIAFEPCGKKLCAVPFRDAQGNEYSLKDAPHADEDAIKTVGFYRIQSAQGHWNLIIVLMERTLQDSTYSKAPTTAHVSLFKLAPSQPDAGESGGNYFQDIASLPMGEYCNSTIALTTFLQQPLPAGVAPDGCMH